MYEIVFTPAAKKEYLKLEKKEKERASLALRRLRINPERYLKKLIGTGYYRLRVGDHRLIIELRKNKLLILLIKIGHRKNIYKKLYF